MNDIFDKLQFLDVDEKHMIRLGHGEEELQTAKDFSRYGRVNYLLEKRLEKLSIVDVLAKSLGVKEDVSGTE